MEVAATSNDVVAVVDLDRLGLVRQQGRPHAADLHSDLQAELLVPVLRRLLRAETAADIREAVEAFVRSAGARLEPPSPSGRGQLPVDLSYGGPTPLVPAADPDTLATLSEVLPNLTADASVAFDRVVRSGFLVTSATVDPLTRVGNRRTALDVLGRVKATDTIVLVDLDHFKKLNDTLGHDAGDAVLRAFGDAASSVIRRQDTAVRLGGEEFALFLSATTADEAGAVVERLREQWRQVRPHPVTFSGGIAAVGALGGQEALKAADAAMYRAKVAGRDRVVVHST